MQLGCRCEHHSLGAELRWMSSEFFSKTQLFGLSSLSYLYLLSNSLPKSYIYAFPICSREFFAHGRYYIICLAVLSSLQTKEHSVPSLGFSVDYKASCISHLSWTLKPRKATLFWTHSVTVNPEYWFVNVLFCVPVSLPLENKTASLSLSGLLWQHSFNWVIYKSLQCIAQLILQVGVIQTKNQRVLCLGEGFLLVLRWWILTASIHGGALNSLRPLF